MIARLAARVARVAAPAGLRRALCAPPAPPVLMETPARSTRKARIREHGMMGLTTAFIEQASKRGADASFRVQSYSVPLNKPVEFALLSVYGFGRSRSKRLAAEVGIHGHYPLARMRESQRSHIRRALNAACISYDDPSNAAGAALQKEVSLNLRRLREIRCYRGIRHEQRLPSRGQRTKTNARTRKRTPPPPHTAPTGRTRARACRLTRRTLLQAWAR